MPAGSKNVPLLSFGVRNPSEQIAVVSQVSVLLLDNDGHLAVESVRLVLDANGNQQADVGELILANLANIPDDGLLSFELADPLSFAARANKRFVVVVDFK